jgi:hypothetical protein
MGWAARFDSSNVRYEFALKFFGDILVGEDLELFEQIFKCKGYNILLVGAFVVQFYEKNSSDSKIKLFAVLFDF